MTFYFDLKLNNGNGDESNYNTSNGLRDDIGENVILCPLCSYEMARRIREYSNNTKSNFAEEFFINEFRMDTVPFWNTWYDSTVTPIQRGLRGGSKCNFLESSYSGCQF